MQASSHLLINNPHQLRDSKSEQTIYVIGDYPE